MNDAVVMVLTVSAGFALLAILGAIWWFASGQRTTLAEGAMIPLEEEDQRVGPGHAA